MTDEFLEMLDGLVLLAPQSLERGFRPLAIVAAGERLQQRALNVLAQAHAFGSHRDAVMLLLSQAPDVFHGSDPEAVHSRSAW